MIKLNHANFFDKFQEILEKYYLQPLDGFQKENLRNGHIERTIHGAQHASRAALWALSIHNLLQELVPGYVSSSLETIAKHLNTDVETVVLLILITVGCHDTARRGEGSDLWESQSAANALIVLNELGLEENQAQLFASAIKFKDKRDPSAIHFNFKWNKEPNNYQDKLKTLGIDIDKDFNQFDYIRKLVNLGDNLDLMRCVGNFQLGYLFNTLEPIEGFKKTHHDAIINLVKTIHQFIYQQQDMRFACTVQDLKKNSVASLPSHFSRKEKLKYEYATNVLAVLFEDALSNQVLGSLIKNFKAPKAEKYQGKLAFDPFIHGTNTSILSTLTKSDFQIMSPLEMLDDYQAATLTGELTGGGYSQVGSAPIKTETEVGKTSFGILSAKGCNSFTFEKISSQYTITRILSKESSLSCFKSAMSRGVNHGFSNINLLLIYLGQIRQGYGSIETLITQEELAKLRSELWATTRFFYFIQLLGRYIYPDFEAIEQLNEDIRNDVTDAIYSILTFEYLIEKIIKNKIDMKAILAHPSQDNLKRALQILELPESCTIQSGFNCDLKAIKLEMTQFFCLTPCNTDDSRDFEPESTFYQLSRNGASDCKINLLLEKFIKKDLSASFFEKLGKEAETHIIALEDRIRLFEKLLEAPQDSFKLTSLQSYFLEKSYPLILVAEDEEKIELFSFQKDEYRSKAALKLGKDIKIIATDTQAHRLEIMKYLELHHINNVQIVLFTDLENSKKSKEKPTSSYHHQDGVPTLRWLSAKKTASCGLGFFGKPVKEIENLLNEAKEYQAIEKNFFAPPPISKTESPRSQGYLQAGFAFLKRII